MSSRDSIVGAPAPPPFVGYYRVDSDLLTVFEIQGSATTAGVVSLFQQFAVHPTPNLLWDLRACALTKLEAGDLHSMVRRLMELDHSGGRPAIGRSAFVCSTDADAIVMRRLITFAEARDYRIRLGLFRDLNVARRWLANA